MMDEAGQKLIRKLRALDIWTQLQAEHSVFTHGDDEESRAAKRQRSVRTDDKIARRPAAKKTTTSE